MPEPSAEIEAVVTAVTAAPRVIVPFEPVLLDRFTVPALIAAAVVIPPA